MTMAQYAIARCAATLLAEAGQRPLTTREGALVDMLSPSVERYKAEEDDSDEKVIAAAAVVPGTEALARWLERYRP